MKPYDQIKQDRLKAALEARPKKCGCTEPKQESEPKQDTGRFREWVTKLADILVKPDEV